MATIHITKQNDNTYEVTVQGRTTTTHIVTVPPGYPEKLARGQITVETLLEKSFDFLLEREPNTSILHRFELPLIGHYFPEYERTLRGMLG